MPLTLKTSKTIEHEINIPVPCFWKRSDGVEWTAVIDQATAITFYLRDDFVTLKHAIPEYFKSDLEKAYSDFDLCDEQEWLNKYAEVLKSISLTPELVNP